MKAFVFVNDKASAYKRYKKGDIPAQFVYGISQLEKMGYEIKVGEGKLITDLIAFFLFKPNLFFMPFTKRKTIAFYALSKLFLFKTKFAGWLHLDIFNQPNGRIKKIIHSIFLPILKVYLRNIDRLFFLSEKTRMEMIANYHFSEEKCHFIPWGGDKNFYSPFSKEECTGNIISTGRENRDLPCVFKSIDNSDVIIDIYTSDRSLPDTYKNKNEEIKINKGFWPYKELLEKVSSTKCMIIPLKKEKIDYCVGLSSLIEAISLGRPVIATYNPYWYIDIEKEGIGYFIYENTPDEWNVALEKIEQDHNMVSSMSQRAKYIFNKKCDFSITEELIGKHITNLFTN